MKGRNEPAAEGCGMIRKNDKEGRVSGRVFSLPVAAALKTAK